VFSWSPPRRRLPPFPTRRSSDLAARHALIPVIPLRNIAACVDRHHRRGRYRLPFDAQRRAIEIATVRGVLLVFPVHQRLRRRVRSEEHTSELQSRVDLVCRLLLE